MHPLPYKELMISLCNRKGGGRDRARITVRPSGAAIAGDGAAGLIATARLWARRAEPGGNGKLIAAILKTSFAVARRPMGARARAIGRGLISPNSCYAALNKIETRRNSKRFQTPTSRRRGLPSSSSFSSSPSLVCLLLNPIMLRDKLYPRPSPPARHPRPRDQCNDPPAQDHRLRELETRIAELDALNEIQAKQLQQKELNEGKLKELVWTLEISLEEVRSQLADQVRSAELSKANQIRLRELVAAASDQMDLAREREERLQEEMEALNAKHEHELAKLHRQVTTLQRENSGLSSRVNEAMADAQKARQEKGRPAMIGRPGVLGKLSGVDGAASATQVAPTTEMASTDAKGEDGPAANADVTTLSAPRCTCGLNSPQQSAAAAHSSNAKLPKRIRIRRRNIRTDIRKFKRGHPRLGAPPIAIPPRQRSVSQIVANFEELADERAYCSMELAEWEKEPGTPGGSHESREGEEEEEEDSLMDVEGELDASVLPPLTEYDAMITAGDFIARSLFAELSALQGQSALPPLSPLSPLPDASGDQPSSPSPSSSSIEVTTPTSKNTDGPLPLFAGHEGLPTPPSSRSDAKPRESGRGIRPLSLSNSISKTARVVRILPSEESKFIAPPSPISPLRCEGENGGKSALPLLSRNEPKGWEHSPNFDFLQKSDAWISPLDTPALPKKSPTRGQREKTGSEPTRSLDKPIPIDVAPLRPNEPSHPPTAKSSAKSEESERFPLFSPERQPLSPPPLRTAEPREERQKRGAISGQSGSEKPVAIKRLQSEPLSFENASLDRSVLRAITSTMMGEFLWKYTKGFATAKRHLRYVWVHPYTRTLYWSEQKPGVVGSSEATVKSAFIESIHTVAMNAPSSQLLPPSCIVVCTPQRELKFSVRTRERHDIWMQSLTYLLSRPWGPTPAPPSTSLAQDSRPYPYHRSKSLDKRPSLHRLFPWKSAVN
ncbi:uncharacterized protein VTP21DRAFT_5208 [Calcarisporiella thermophila]|uniref:uncharacterized protein n=1 Tax=Calcarisporiella thermophila TaxID=911321 RepID=UPI0037447B4B